jgi:hypothetical protein
MPRRLTDGWFSGLGAGFRDSGHFLGAVVPIAIVTIAFVVVIGTIVWVRGCVKGAEKPKPCSNYSYKMSIIGDSKASCTKWPAMEMRIEKRWVKADIVHCACTAASNPKPEAK